MGIGDPEHGRLLLIVDGQGIFIPAGKGVPLRRVDEGGGHTGDGIQTFSLPRQGREAAEQPPGIGVAGIIKYFLRRADLHDLPRVHDGHPIRAARHDPQVMGDQHRAGSQLLLDIPEQLQDLSLHRHIQGGGGFVRQ